MWAATAGLGCVAKPRAGLRSLTSRASTVGTCTSEVMSHVLALCPVRRAICFVLYCAIRSSLGITGADIRGTANSRSFPRVFHGPKCVHNGTDFDRVSR